MRRMFLGALAAVSTVVVAAAVSGSAQSGGAPQAVTKAQYDRWKTELSNWGRWGKTIRLAP